LGFGGLTLFLVFLDCGVSYTKAFSYITHVFHLWQRRVLKFATKQDQNGHQDDEQRTRRLRRAR
jgi:hypothetical protein